jgi:uncharacterized protein
MAETARPYWSLPKMQTLLYLHGFRSSSQSIKAQQLGAALRHVQADWEYITPDLSPDPELAMAWIADYLARNGSARECVTLVGSSLGGYYAHMFAEQIGCRAVLLNPSLKPWETLAPWLGEQTNLHTSEMFTLLPAHLEALRARAKPAATMLSRYLVVVEMGDELLDHNITCRYFDGAATIAVAGGDHNLASFPSHISQILRFAGLADSKI